jgi:hypothetical protein
MVGIILAAEQPRSSLPSARVIRPAPAAAPAAADFRAIALSVTAISAQREMGETMRAPR